MQGLDLSSWRFAFNGAEPVSPDTINSFVERFSKYGLQKNAISPVYGLAECTVGVAFTTPGEPWRMDLLDREVFSRTGEAGVAPAHATTPRQGHRRRPLRQGSRPRRPRTRRRVRRPPPQV